MKWDRNIQYRLSDMYIYIIIIFLQWYMIAIVYTPVGQIQ